MQKKEMKKIKIHFDMRLPMDAILAHSYVNRQGRAFLIRAVWHP